jgi:hypothetical protein
MAFSGWAFDPLVKKGRATDAEILKACSEAFGLGGGCSGPGVPYVSYHGGANVWLKFGFGDRTFVYRGRALVALARDVLQLPNHGLLGHLLATRQGK